MGQALPVLCWWSWVSDINRHTFAIKWWDVVCVTCHVVFSFVPCMTCITLTAWTNYFENWFFLVICTFDFSKHLVNVYKAPCQAQFFNCTMFTNMYMYTVCLTCVQMHEVHVAPNFVLQVHFSCISQNPQFLASINICNKRNKLRSILWSVLCSSHNLISLYMQFAKQSG